MHSIVLQTIFILIFNLYLISAEICLKYDAIMFILSKTIKFDFYGNIRIFRMKYKSKYVLHFLNYAHVGLGFQIIMSMSI